MSGDRYSFSTDDIGRLVIVGRGGALVRAQDGVPVAHVAFAAVNQLRAELAAVVGERDSALAEIERLNQWFESELIESPESSSAWRQRAEQAEARLAAIDNARTVCEIVAANKRLHIHMIADAPPIGTELIAKPAKESPATNSFEDTRDPQELDYDEREE